jgi:hypothetical protein
MSEQQLMDYFKFDAADLAANRSGHFTDKQRQRLITEDKSSRRWGLVGGGGLMLIGLVGLAGAIFAVANDSDVGFRIGFGLGFGCIWPLIWGGLGFFIMRNALGKHELKLVSVRGQANIVSRESYSSEHHTTSVYHELHLGGHEFEVEEDAADVIMQGQEYILYYVDSTDEILSAEEVGGGR